MVFPMQFVVIFAKHIFRRRILWGMLSIFCLNLLLLSLYFHLLHNFSVLNLFLFLLKFHWFNLNNLLILAFIVRIFDLFLMIHSIVLVLMLQLIDILCIGKLLPCINFYVETIVVIINMFWSTLLILYLVQFVIF
jgi:hypothetical protein